MASGWLARRVAWVAINSRQRCIAVRLTSWPQPDWVSGLTDAKRDQVVAAWITNYRKWDRLDEFDKNELPEEPILHLGNRLNVDDGYEVAEPFLEDLKRYHDAEMGRVDLGSASGKKALDAWVKKHTAGMIEESSIQPSPDLVMVLANAALFAARWEQPCKVGERVEEPFTKANGSQIDVAMMWFTTTKVVQKDGWTVAQRPCSGLQRLLYSPIGRENTRGFAGCGELETHRTGARGRPS